jgi:hypothetical protein
MEVVSKMAEEKEKLRWYTFTRPQSLYVHIDDIIPEGEYAIITVHKQNVDDKEIEDIGQFKWALQSAQLKEMTMDLLRAKGRKNHLLKIDYHFEKMHIFEVNYVYSFGTMELFIPISKDLSHISVNKSGTKPYSIIYGNPTFNQRSFCSFSTLETVLFVRDCLDRIGYPMELSAEKLGANKTRYLQICELARSYDEWLSQLAKNNIYTSPQDAEEKEVVDLGYDELEVEEIQNKTFDEKLAACQSKLEEVAILLKELREDGI